MITHADHTMRSRLKPIVVIPDTVEMNREAFKKLLREHSAKRPRRFGFSVKHTADIEKARKEAGEFSGPGSLYDLPVQWNTTESYFA
ncbi:MAG: hypothetical protein EBU46_00375 [Nitrosomonadaceae bacterium]|nr:hypothetical protein [Nitrosomonadaceae bacterium]